MNVLPVNKRKYHAFISYAHADKAIVDPIYNLLNTVANIPVWYDATDMQVSASFASELPNEIVQCRSLIIILSKNSISSNWVKSECEHAVNHHNSYPDFRILPICIDNCKTPVLLEKFSRIDLPEGKLDMITAHKILSSLYLNDAIVDHDVVKDVFVSRSWRENETAMADTVCQLFDRAGLRLVGDSTDQQNFGEGNRVKSIISSCGGLVAVVPDRGNGTTSKYILDEVRLAIELQRPCLLIFEPAVQLPDDIARSAVCICSEELQDGNTDCIYPWVEDFIESLVKPEDPHNIFYSTRFNDNEERNKFVRQFIERITSMQCVIGDQIKQADVQKVITSAITRSHIMIADISSENINTMIEAGIARGANKTFYLIASGPRRSPPFMFRDRQVWYYDDNVQLIGTIFRLTYPYRRRIINYELPKAW